MLVLRALIADCESAIAAIGAPDDPLEIAQSIGAVATKLVAAGIRWENDLDPARAAVAVQLRELALRCQRVIGSLVRGPADVEQAHRGRLVLRAVADVLAALYAEMEPLTGGPVCAAGVPARRRR